MVAPLPFIANVAVPSVNVNAALDVVNVIVEPESMVVAPVTSISKIPASISTIEYVTITTTGNSQDFGDVTLARGYLGGCSDVHGGLG